jgi:hypothetical protein
MSQALFNAAAGACVANGSSAPERPRRNPITSAHYAENPQFKASGTRSAPFGSDAPLASQTDFGTPECMRPLAHGGSTWKPVSSNK